MTPKRQPKKTPLRKEVERHEMSKLSTDPKSAALYADSVLGDLASQPLQTPPQRTSVWRGPIEDGITQSMLSNYLVDAERFRIMYFEGLRPIPTFNHLIEFGNMWHLAEELHARGKVWSDAVRGYAGDLCEKFPMQQEQINHWYSLCVALFPIYADYWSHHPDMIDSTPLLQEEKFALVYKVGNRAIKLRGKWDSVDVIDKRANKNLRDRRGGIWLQENKTKSSIDQEKLTRQLRFDLQTMVYIIALEEAQSNNRYKLPLVDIAGVRYNVIRRSAHKSTESMLKKVHEDLRDGRANEWFSRWNVELSRNDIETFRRRALDPILLNLADDYEWWAYCWDNKVDVYAYEIRSKQFPSHTRRHFLMPYLGYNPLADGNDTVLDQYIFTGNKLGLEYITHDDLFPELA